MGDGRYRPFSFSLDGKGYIGGGSKYGLLKDTWEYNPATDNWIQKNDFTENITSTQAFIVNGKVYCNIGTAAPYVYQYNQVNDNWHIIVDELPEPYIHWSFSTLNRAFVITEREGFWEFIPPKP